MEHIGQCRLCLNNGILKDSHLLPKSMYKLMHSSNSSKTAPYLITNQKIHQTSQQVKQYLLCGDCEQRFSKKGETWVMRNCWRSEDQFHIKEILDKTEPLISSDGLKAYAGADIPDLDMDKLVYFGASIFWRASVSEWYIESEKIHISLGPYEEPLRLYLLDLAPFPKNMVLEVCVSELKKMDLSLLPKSSRTKKGCYRYKFIIPGLYFTLLVGSQLTDTERNYLCAEQSPEKFIHVWSQADYKSVVGFTQKIMNNRK